MRFITSFVVVVCVILFGTVSPSAIPMWEYLTRNEKVMYLYNMFQTQIQDFCETSTCRQELKNYGWNKLKNMSEDHLDKMDPFQRDSNNIIWGSVMDGHKMMNMTPKSKQTSQDLEEYYNGEDNSEFQANVETTNKVPPPKGFEQHYNGFTIIMGNSEYGTQDHKGPSYTDDNYTSLNEIQDSTTSGGIPIIDRYGEYHRIPLTGPMVMKVQVDGTPVKDDKDPLPQDDDLRQYKLTKTVLQNL